MKQLRGLYAITDPDLISTDQLKEKVEQAIQGGCRLVQYRNKSNDHLQRFEQSSILRDLCQTYKVPLIINDDVKLAKLVRAQGVHLGKGDVEVTSARTLLGDDAIIGVSCYNQLSLAQYAIKSGATYVAFGRFFDSHTKPKAVHASIDLLYQARNLLNCPIVAIGGITPDNGAELVAAGAHCLAVIYGLFGQQDIFAAAQRYAQLFN
jgi:thiamine-phosphate pyrophosphorylase